MEKILRFNKKSAANINNLIKRKLFRGVIVVTAQNFIDGGPWAIINAAIKSLSICKKDFLIVVILYKKLDNEFQNVINLICKIQKNHGFIGCFTKEKIFNEFSQSILIDIEAWISMHDITPKVKAKRIITYFHNPTPFLETQILSIFFYLQEIRYLNFYILKYAALIFIQIMH